MVVVLSRLDEVVVLDVLLHLLSGHHKVIVSAVHLIVSLGPGRVCDRTTAFILKSKSDPTRCRQKRGALFLKVKSDRCLRGLTRDAGPELVGELGDEVVVDPILHGAEDDDGPRVVH